MWGEREAPGVQSEICELNATFGGGGLIEPGKASV